MTGKILQSFIEIIDILYRNVILLRKTVSCVQGNEFTNKIKCFAGCE